MEFIEKLYSNEYFAPVLFTIVGILTVLFIVVLILALLDAKKSRKSVVEIVETPDEFAKLNSEFTEDVMNFKEDKKEVVEENKEEVVIDKVEPDADSFEEVTIEAPQEEVISDANEEIKVENEEVASVELERAENDLDEIAATLLREYQKEDSDDEKIETPHVVDDQISPVFVTPDTLPNKVEENNDVTIDNMPSLSDIPLPQPVRVVSQSQIIDSSKKDNKSINDIETEEYNIKR